MADRLRRRTLLLGLASAAAALACGSLPSQARPGRPARKRVPDAATDHVTRFQGDERTYRLLVPRRATRPYPLVLALHGGGGDDESLLLPHKRIPDTAKERGWAVAFPSGNRGQQGKWSPDDDAFLLQVVDAIAERAPIDRSRVYLVGFSGGGRLAYQTAAEHPDRIAAIGVVGGRAGVRGPDGAWVAPYDPNATGATGVPVFAVVGGRDPIRHGAEPDAFAACMRELGDEAACAARTANGLTFDESLALWIRANGATEARADVFLPHAPREVQAWRHVNPSTGVAVQGALDPLLAHAWPSWNLAATLFDFFEEMHRDAL